MSPLELIQKSQCIEIAPGSHVGSRETSEALTLFHALSKIGKSVRINKELFAYPSAAWVRQEFFPMRTAVVSIKHIAPFVSGVSYEKSNQDLRFSFSLSQDRGQPEQVEIEQSLDSDLTIIVGENQALHNQEITTNPHPRLWNSQKALEAVVALLSPFQIPGAKLLLRALQGMNYLTTTRVCLMTLEKKDFRESQTNLKDIIAVLKDIISWSHSDVSLVALLESAPFNRIQGIMKTSSTELFKKLSQTTNFQKKDAWALFHFPGNDMNLAKEKVTSMLS